MTGFHDKMIEYKDKGKIKKKIYSKEAQALRAVRIAKRITREDAATYIDRGKQALERFENGRQLLSPHLQKKLLRRYKVTLDEFNQILAGTTPIARYSASSIHYQTRKSTYEYRKYQVDISKEAKVLKSMRRMKGLTKQQLAAITGFHRSSISHRESGRTNIKHDDIKRITSALGFTMEEFNNMLETSFDRDQILEECFCVLEKIENQRLLAVRELLKSFGAT